MPVVFVSLSGLFTLWFVLKSTERWLIVAILAHLILFLNPHGDVTSVPAAITYSVLFFPGLFLWFGKKIIRSERIVDNWAELALVSFLIFAFLSIGWASWYDFSVIKGVREFALFVPYLMFFPLREYVAEKGGRKVIWTLLIVCAVAAIYGVIQYRLSVSVAQYFWQIIGGREALNEPLFMSGLIILLGFVAARRYNQVLIIALISLDAVALVLTFSRGYWMGAALGILLLALMTKGGSRRRIMTLSFLSAVVVVVVASLMFPKVFVDIAGGLGTRLATAGLQDLSLKNRLAESLAVLKNVKTSPIIGHGMGAEFTFFNLIINLSTTTWYIHNAFLFLLYKLGIVGMALYLIYYLYILTKTAAYAFRCSEESTRLMLLSFVSVMCVMLIVSITSPQFYDRVAILVLTTVWGISAGTMKSGTVNAEDAETV